MSPRSSIIVSINRLPIATRARVLSCLVEGMGVRPTARATGVAINTIRSLIRDLGPACAALHNEKVRGLSLNRVECDEAWAFCYSRKKNVPAQHKGTFGYGDVWIWTAIDSASKLVPSYLVAERDADAASTFLRDLGQRLSTKRVEITTDGFQGYHQGVLCMSVDGLEVDWARVVKNCATPNGRWDSKGNRYQQPALVSVTKVVGCGTPNMEAAGTSYAERMNLSLRQQNRKLSRLTNGHAKKLEMLQHSMAIYYAFYNFCRPHQALDGFTPAEANRLAERRWTPAELVALAN
jgi:IS1 family transposase